MDQRFPEDVESINRVIGKMFQVIRKDAGFDLEAVAVGLEVDLKELQDHEDGVIPLPAVTLFRAGLLFGVKISAFFQPFYHPGLFELE